MFSEFKYTNRDNFYKMLSKNNPDLVNITQDLERHLKLFGMPVHYTSVGSITTKYRGYEYKFTIFDDWKEIRVIAMFAQCYTKTKEQTLQILNLANDVSFHSAPAIAWFSDDELYSVANMRYESSKINPNDFIYVMRSCDSAIRNFSSRSIFYKSLRECCEL